MWYNVVIFSRHFKIDISTIDSDSPRNTYLNPIPNPTQLNCFQVHRVLRPPHSPRNTYLNPIPNPTQLNCFQVHRVLLPPLFWCAFVAINVLVNVQDSRGFSPDVIMLILYFYNRLRLTTQYIPEPDSKPNTIELFPGSSCASASSVLVYLRGD